jgi:hypothetical protein
MRMLSIILVFILTTTNQTFACSCIWQGDFLTVAPKSELVAMVKINNYLTLKNINGKPMPISMEVEIVRVFYGQETRKFVTIWGDNGALCRPYLDNFNIDNYYVIAFIQGSETIINANKDEKKTDYAISNCGNYWLTVDKEKEMATGGVSKKHNAISIGDLEKYFNKIEEKNKKKRNMKEIVKTIESIYIDRVKIDKSNENLLINVKTQKQKYVFKIQYKKTKIIFPIFYSELHDIDSISVKINSFAKKREVNISESVMYNKRFGVSTCIRCKEDIPYKSMVTLYRRQ